MRGDVPGLSFWDTPQGAVPVPGARDELGNPVYQDVAGNQFTVMQQPTPQGDGWSWGGVANALATPFRLAMGRGSEADVAAMHGVGNALTQGLTAPGRAAQGEPVTYGDAWSTALDYGVMGAPMAAPEGALRAGAVATETKTMAQTVADMLRSGRASEVTDEMMAAVDPQEMWRLYESGATGADMPMDAASRMARAQDMGFSDQIHYHGANQPFDAFRASERGMQGPGVYVTQIAKDASGYAMDHGVIGQNGLQIMIPKGRYAPDQVVSDATRAILRTDPEMSWADANKAAVNELQRQGYVGAAVENVRPQYFEPTPENPLGVGVVQRNVFDPSRLRSQFARFDPRLAHLANLSAGVGGVGMVNALMTDGNQ